MLTLMKEINTVVADKHYFNNWVELFLLPNLWKFYYQDFDARSTIEFFQSNPPLEEYGF